MEGFEKVCKATHKALDDKIERHEKWLGEHEGKIDVLEKSDATNTANITNVCKSVTGLTKAVWGLVSAIIIMLLGFVFWYIQSLPR